MATPEPGGLLNVGGGLIVQWDHAGRPQDGLAQPAKAEQQQQPADRNLHDIDRNACQRGTDRGNQGGEHRQSEASPGQGPPPSAHRTDGQNDGERFDELHE